jgi:hypothetical protein
VTLSPKLFYGLGENTMASDRARPAEGLGFASTAGPGTPGGRSIGERATLLGSASSRACGIVMELTKQEARALYSEPSVRELHLAGANPAYAKQLSRLVEALQFDSAYVEEIAAFGGMPDSHRVARSPPGGPGDLSSAPSHEPTPRGECPRIWTYHHSLI